MQIVELMLEISHQSRCRNSRADSPRYEYTHLHGSFPLWATVGPGLPHLCGVPFLFLAQLGGFGCAALPVGIQFFVDQVAQFFKSCQRCENSEILAEL